MDLYYINCEKFEGKTLKEKQHNAGRYIVESVAKDVYKLDNTELTIENKKPKYKYSDIQFSISHCKCYVVVGFDKNPIGIDIEEIKERNYKPIAERMNFNLKEDTLEEFYRCWTVFEAEYKLQQKANYTKTIHFKENYKISIASIKKINLLQIKELKY